MTVIQQLKGFHSCSEPYYANKTFFKLLFTSYMNLVLILEHNHIAFSAQKILLSYMKHCHHSLMSPIGGGSWL